jgi:glycosyltransferase involved in cell wall biosynthesis
MIIEEQRFYFSLDSDDPVPISPQEFLLDGWFLPRESPRGEAWSLKLVVDGAEIPAIGECPRPDVGRAFDLPGSAMCGFVVPFGRPRWDPKIRLIAGSRTERIPLIELTLETRSKRRRQKTSNAQIKTYRDWLIHCEEGLFWPEDEISNRMKALGHSPLISIILPTSNTDLFFLERCIQSVLKQRYLNWQLCITDDGSHDARLVAYLQNLADHDARIAFQRNQTCGGISRASNRSLESAKGEYVVLLDHDDELHPFALLEVVRHLNEFRDTAIVYSDEDKMDAYCRRSQPAFKPGFDLDMFRAFNYIGHLVAVRRDIVQRIGGFRPCSDGAQDWDLLLRAIETVGPAAVSHIPKPLYHWRMHEDSTSMDLLSKPYVRKAWVHVLSAHLGRMGESGTVEPGIAFGTMRVKYELPERLRIAVFIRREDGEYQRALLETLLGPKMGRLYHVADCIIRPALPSDREEREICSPLSSLSEVNEEIFVFINRPLETVNHVFFEELARQAMRPECGVVTGISLSRDATIAHSGYVGTSKDELKDPFLGLELPGGSYMSQTLVTRRVETISEFFFATHRRHIASVGGLASIVSTGMPKLVNKLVGNAAREELQVIVTPFAVTTFDDDFSSPQSSPLRQRGRNAFDLNPNLEAFADFDSLIRGRI